MPVRNMLFDILQYVKQINEYAKYHKKMKDTKTKDEFLSGVTKDDKIILVVTLMRCSFNFYIVKLKKEVF